MHIKDHPNSRVIHHSSSNTQANKAIRDNSRVMVRTWRHRQQSQKRLREILLCYSIPVLLGWKARLVQKDVCLWFHWAKTRKHRRQHLLGNRSVGNLGQCDRTENRRWLDNVITDVCNLERHRKTLLSSVLCRWTESGGHKDGKESLIPFHSWICRLGQNLLKTSLKFHPTYMNHSFKILVLISKEVNISIANAAFKRVCLTNLH